MAAQTTTNFGEDREVLFCDQWLDVSRSGEQIVVESQAWSNPSYRRFSTGLLFLCIPMCAVFWFGYASVPSIKNLVLTTGISVICGFGGFWNAIHARYARRFVFDFDSQLCHFSNVPGFGLTIPFAEIDAITIVPLRNMIPVALARRGTSRLLRMHLFIGLPPDPEDVDVRAKRFADVMSEVLRCPINVIEDATIFTNWRLMSWR